MALYYSEEDRDISGGNLTDARTILRNCEYDVYSMFGIKKDKHSVHSAYKIGRIIGDGNFAIVRECRDRKTQKPFALKIINKGKVKGKEHMIENEILILRKISHPNIVQLFEEFETPKEIYLVMELVEGGDLFDAIVSNTRFSEPEAAFMIKDLASAVQYLHLFNIVHRDIKPENLLVVNRTDGRKSIKLADFGLSIEVKSPMFLVCGTPTYVAPEILDESGYALKVDVWAIGVICYILLCGFPPFRSANHDQEELFDKILRGDFEYLEPFWDDVSDAPRDLIDRLLVVDASERFDAVEVLQHFWIKKWTEPIEKIQRELSEAEEANIHTRKRLRGIALAIQSVISLLHYVRSNNNSNILKSQTLNLSSAKLTESQTLIDEKSIKTSPNISRIPRPKPQAGLHIVAIRKSITTPIRRRAGSKASSPASARTPGVSTTAPDYSLKKGFLKREEAIQRAFVRLNRVNKFDVSAVKRGTSPAIPRRLPDTNTSSPSRNKHVKFRPTSVIDVRENNDLKDTTTNRPASAQSVRKKFSKHVPSVPCNTSPKKTSTPVKVRSKRDEKGSSLNISMDSSQNNVPGESDNTASNGVKLRKKANRPRPRSMVETATTEQNISEFLKMNDLEMVVDRIAPCETSEKKTKSKSIFSGSIPQAKAANESKVSPRKVRPTSLLLNTSTIGTYQKALTPMTAEGKLKKSSWRKSNPNLQRHFEQNITEPKPRSKNLSKFKAANLSSPVCGKPRDNTQTPPKTSQRTKQTTLRSNSVSSVSSTTNRSRSPTRKKSLSRSQLSLADESPRNRSESRSRANSTASSRTNSPMSRRKLSTDRNVHPWNPSTKPRAGPKKSTSPSPSPSSPRKQYDRRPASSSSRKGSVDGTGKSIRITTEVNKRKNIKFPDGKTVDRETKTTTTVSMDVEHSQSDKTESHVSLLSKVKNLAQEIEILSKSDDFNKSSDSSSDSITTNLSSSKGTSASRANSDLHNDVITEETDRFSETEYLSVK